VESHELVPGFMFSLEKSMTGSSGGDREPIYIILRLATCCFSELVRRHKYCFTCIYRFLDPMVPYSEEIGNKRNWCIQRLWHYVSSRIRVLWSRKWLANYI
jgi:hypothetical protein